MYSMGQTAVASIPPAIQPAARAEVELFFLVVFDILLFLIFMNRVNGLRGMDASIVFSTP